MALRQGGTRLAGHTYPNLMQVGRRITKTAFFQQKKTKNMTFYKKRYHENGIAFCFVFLYTID